MRRDFSISRPILGRAVLALIVAAVLSFSMVTTAQARKLALVVGNQAYRHIPPLTNPGRDARGMSETLRRLGFEVTLLTDVNTEMFWVVLDTFAKQAGDAESVVFYYSGHAFQVDGQNHLLPVSANFTATDEIGTQTWAMNEVIGRLQSANTQTLIFLDACRTSPVQGRVGAKDGLAQIATRAGTFVSFATRPGATSFDRDGETGNSPYTRALLAHMETPGLSISDLMIKVRNDVEAATEGQQTPWDQSALRQQFYFNPEASELELAEARGIVVAPVASGLPQFEIVEGETTIAGAPAPVIEPPKDAALALLKPEARPPVIQRIEAAEKTAKVIEPAETRNTPGVAPTVTEPVAALPKQAASKQITAPKPAVPVVAVPENAIPVPLEAAVPEDLPRAVQTELKRIGCYTMGVDGDWGNGSRRAMRRYLTEKDQKPEALEPTAVLYRQLLTEPDGICKPVVAKAPVRKKATRTKRTTKKVATTQRKAAPVKKKAAPAPAKKKVTCKFVVVAIICSNN